MTKAKHIGHRLLPYSPLFSRVILGGVLIFAGIPKLRHTDTLEWEIEQFRILPDALSTAYSNALPTLEIILGITLILGIAIKISALFSGMLVLSFTIAKITALVRGLEIDICNCFGPAMPLLTLESLAIDLVLLALSVHLLIHKDKPFSLEHWFTNKFTTKKESTRNR